MRLADLDLRDLLQFDPAGGVMRFAGERALIFDAVALGILRRTLIEALGVAATRGILTRFGYAHGQRTAAAMKDAFPWDSDDEWRISGGRLHRLQGQVVPEPVRDTREFVEDIWHDSYEAEQHLSHLGRCDQPVCWALCGFASGYLSYTNQRPIYFIETRCRGRGDSVCHVIGRPRDDWPTDAASELAYFETTGLDEAIAGAVKKLRQAERQLRSREQRLAGYKARPEPDGITAASPAMRKVLDLARRVARVDSTVLVTGESGVGKERIARMIHEESARAGRALVAINCGAMPENLLESELFGHAKGSFTGASQDRPGLFEEASGGTLFLDEIGEVSAPMQVKLLRALQEQEIRRIGENRNRSVDVRVIAATNRNLVDEVKAGRFRQDLYYRLRVVELAVPPLRERVEDILPLARVLLATVAQRTRSKATSFTPKAVAQLQRYPWPGNVRELENALERAVVMATGARIDADDLPAEIAQTVASSWIPGDERSLADVEKSYILSVLDAHGGNRTRAAAQLRIAPATLYRKLSEYGIKK